MATNSASDYLQREDNEAQKLAIELGLYPDWRT
jgi:hypothetical protein